MFGGKDGDVLLPEMMIIFAGTLQYGGFVFAEIVAGGGGVLLESGCSSPLSLTDIATWAGYGIGSCTWYMIYMSISFLFVQLIFGMDKGFSQ